jgi:hypothetical protein
MFDLKIVAANDPIEVVYSRVKEYIKEKTKWLKEILSKRFMNMTKKVSF